MTKNQRKNSMKKQNGETLDTTKRIIENDLLKDLIAISFHIQCEEKYRQNILMPYDQQSLIISCTENTAVIQPYYQRK